MRFKAGYKVHTRKESSFSPWGKFKFTAGLSADLSTCLCEQTASEPELEEIISVRNPDVASCPLKLDTHRTFGEFSCCLIPGRTAAPTS